MNNSTNQSDIRVKYSGPEMKIMAVRHEKGFCFSDSEGTATHSIFNDFGSADSDFM